MLGSQIFDYWRDPWGQKHEHYADGDLFDAAQLPGYHVLDRAGLYQWGPDLPDDFIDAKLTPRRLVNVLKLAVNDRPRLKKMLALKSSVVALHLNVRRRVQCFQVLPFAVKLRLCS